MIQFNLFLFLQLQLIHTSMTNDTKKVLNDFFLNQHRVYIKEKIIIATEPKAYKFGKRHY